MPFAGSARCGPCGTVKECDKPLLLMGCIQLVVTV